jgi:hypothetical protein
VSFKRKIYKISVPLSLRRQILSLYLRIWVINFIDKKFSKKEVRFMVKRGGVLVLLLLLTNLKAQECSIWVSLGPTDPTPVDTIYGNIGDTVRLDLWGIEISPPGYVGRLSINLSYDPYYLQLLDVAFDDTVFGGYFFRGVNISDSTIISFFAAICFPGGCIPSGGVFHVGYMTYLIQNTPDGECVVVLDTVTVPTGGTYIDSCVPTWNPVCLHRETGYCPITYEYPPLPFTNLTGMAYDSNRNLIYIVESRLTGSDIVIFDPITGSYCVSYDNTTNGYQMGIAYDPEEDVIYVGGWYQHLIYKFEAPQCNQNLQLLDIIDLGGTELSLISGLAWDDHNGNLFVITSGNPYSSMDILGKVNVSTGEILWTAPVIFHHGNGYINSLGLCYYPLSQALYAISNYDNSVNLFLHPEVDDCESDTFCFLTTALQPEYYSYGVIQVDTLPYSISVISAEEKVPEVRLFPEYIHTFIRGDCNSDSIINFADVSYLAYYIFFGGEASCLDALDVNDDGYINLADLSYFANFLLFGGPPPPPPFPDPGFDPTLDSLWCR